MRITLTKRVVCDLNESELTVEVESQPGDDTAEVVVACSTLFDRLENGPEPIE